MKLNEVYQIANKLAPVGLSHEYCKNYDAYDNSGILVDTGDEIEGILFSLDLSQAAIEKAISLGANLIITHHPAIYGKIGRVCEYDPLGNKLITCIRNGISVLSMHLNLDMAEGGVDESLMQGVCLASGKAESPTPVCMHVVKDKDALGAYGRAYDIKPCSLAELKAGLEKEFSSKRILCYGDENAEIKRVASFCGAGIDEEGISFALDNEGGKADLVLSSDYKHHLIALALEEGLSVVILTHYASENYGFKKYYEKIRQQVKIPCAFHTDEHLL